MRKLILAAVASGALQAAVIRGVVVEKQTGKPLPRALVVAAPVPGTPGTAVSARTSKSGAFDLSGLAAGAYLVMVTRRSFAPFQYGQKRWRGSGIPITLEATASADIRIAMQRFASISGSVFDENDVGLPEHEVGIYRVGRPPQLVAKGKTDDRGVYQISGVHPGSYLIRALGGQFEDGGYLPTWSRQTTRLDEAEPVDLQLDQQATLVNVRPFAGQLFTVAGRAQSYFSSGQITVSLSSETGQEVAVADRSGNFQFRPVPPGNYELTAAAPNDPRNKLGPQAAWMPIIVGRDRTDWRINLGSLPDLRILVADSVGSSMDPRPVSIWARRKDLSSESQAQTIDASQAQSLLPGRWEFLLSPGPNWYVSGFDAPGSVAARPDGWNETMLNSGATSVRFILSPNPGAIRGVVVSEEKPVAGSPVFLEPFDPQSGKRLLDVRSTRTDTRGQYNFSGLAPGTYRLLSSFDFQTVEPAEMDAARPITVKVEQRQEAVVSLNLYVIP